MSLMNRIFGKARQGDLPTPMPTPTQIDPLPDTRVSELETLASTRRELVRVMVRDTQRAAGIPDGWIESQVMLEVSRGQTFVHLRLIVRHWDKRLVKYSVAFQRKVLSEIERFEPDARQWIGSMTWLYPEDSDCPHLQLPDPATWSRVEVVDIEIDDVQDDLAQLFAVRDANMAGPVSGTPRG